ncbi:autotransporter domain-containing protein [Achromobacter kerstersii]|uniref:autotransporter domain-containing protein n=1 Tax=Achromobacter kerstersii TaxID=1353890 RepID=UPI003CFD53CF
MPRKRSLVVAMAAVCGLFGYLPAAQAVCSPAFSPGATVTCTGLDFSLDSAVSNMDVVVASGAEVNVILGDASALTLSGNNTRFTNLGTVQPSGNFSTMLASGVTIGNANNSIVSVTNQGIIRGTVGLLGVNLPTVQGVALNIQNGAFGATTVTNSGTISSTPLLGISMATADAPVVAISGGGQVSMTNTGTIAGRVAFEASAGGNTFTNVGTISGSVSLGAGKGPNKFTAITGSWVDKGLGLMDAISVQNSTTMVFAKTGQIDGGAGGDNTLTLQNAIGGGSGTAGSGSISSANYVNFSNLIVNSGSWNLSGPVLTGTTTTALNGGRLTVDNAAALGPGAVTANGGDLLAGASSLTLSNAMGLSAGGLTVSGSNALILGGVLSGAGSLTKSGLGTLALQADNTYAGTTTVSGGILQLGTGGTTGSLGTGAVVNNGQVALVRSNNATLSNAFSGAGTIVKNGTGVASLTGDSSAFTGSTTVSSGGLTVSNKLGGDVTVSPGATLAGSGTISGNVGASGGTLQGTQGQTLTIGGNLNLSNAQINVALGAAGTSAALFDVTGALTLINSTINVTDLGGLGTGVYRLFDYGAMLTYSSINFGSLPAGVGAGSLLVQLATPGQVNLVSTVGTVFDYWDGDTAGSHTNGAVNGGSGIWNASNSNWTQSDGASNGAFASPSFATFKGTAGVVTVDAGAGAIGVKGMTIGTDGYVIEGDSIALQGGSQTTIAVGNGTLASSAFIGTINASLTGASKLFKTDYGTLVLGGNNSYTGGTDIQFGTLSISADNNLGAANTGVAMVGGTLATTGSFSTNRNIALTQNGAINVAADTQLGLTGTVSGPGALIKQGAGTLELTGANTYGSTQVQAGTLIGNSASIRGNLQNAGTVIFDQTWDDSVSGMLLGAGAITKRGAGILTLNGVNTLNWNIEDGTLASNATRYTANATIGAAGTLRFNQATDADYAGKLSGSGTFEKSGAGMLSLNADSSAFTGTTNVTSGTLIVTNKLGGNANVTSGRLHVNGTLSGNAAIGNNVILSGAGTIGQNVTLTGGILQGTQGKTLKIGGNLTLDNASQVNVSLGRAPANALFNVGGDLALAGTLNITDQGAFGAGVYRLFDYGGALTTNTLAIGAAPTGITANDLRIQTAVNGQVNLMSTAGATLSFWDGSNTAQRDNGVIDGGAGTWRTDGLNWTNADGTLNGRFQPNPTFAVFQGTAGTVTVDASAGGVGVTGMQISTTGYRIEGNPITLAGGAETIVRVGSGSLSGASITGTIASNLTGASKLVKADYGTLVLAGSNAYTGGTEVRTGALSVSSDDNLGAAAGGLTFNGGALATTASFDSARAVTLTQAGAITVAAGTTLGLQGAIGGTGTLQKLGAGTLTLTGANSYGNTQVQAGTLVGDAASVRGDLENNGSVVFKQAADASYAGYISGTGSMVKQGAGELTLTGISSQDWRIDAGTLTASAGRYTGNTMIASGATLRFDQTAGSSYDSVLSGAGQLTKTGAGQLTLTADSSAFTGRTEVQAGTLMVLNKLGGNASVTGGLLYIDGELNGNAAISGGGTLFNGGRITGDTTLAGAVLLGEQGSKLFVGGDLTLDSASQVNVLLGRAPTPASALFDVAGNLTLAGTLNVTDNGGFGAGIYRLFDYGGSLVNNGLAVGATPAGVAAGALALQTAVPGQVNLTSTSGATLSFWDGGNTARHDNGAIDGGSGTWRADGRNWANLDGTLNGVFQPNPTFAVFQGTAGTVSVDNSAGAIGVTGMQIATTGYRIQGDDIALQGAGGESIIRVGAGSAADATTTGTIASRLTGASKLAKTDFGTLVLTADNTYTGGTDVRQGGLSVSKDANLGAAAGGLTLSGGVLATTASFDTNRAVAITRTSGIDVASGTTFGLAGAITGSGDVTKTGGGMLTVSGDGSAYTGNALVQSGVLNLASTGKLGGTLTLANGALLQGAGQVGATTLQSGAILAPGNVNGTLNVAGDLTFMPGSVYQVAADPASSASARVVVSGVANLAGSVVHVGPEGGFESTRQYTILTAGSINGQFNTVSSNYAFLDPALRYGAQDVTLQLGRKQVQGDPATPNRPITFADAARTGNQRAVANALDSLPSGNALHEYILTLPEGAPAAAFNSLSGEAHASVASSLMGSINVVRTLPLSHLRANLNAGMRPGAPTAQAGGTLSASALPSSNAQPAWAELVGNWQTQNATDNTAQVRQHTGGVFAGADHAVGKGWRVGGAVGYTDSKIRVDDLASKADVSGYSAAIYGGKSFDAGAGKLNLLVGTSYTWHDVSTERYATVAGASQKLTADYGASTTQLFTELGYAMPLSDRTTLEPFAGVAWSDLRSRSFQETGGSAALTGQSSSDKQTSSTLGVRAQTDFTLAGAEGRLRGTLGWRHAFGDVLPQSTMAFDGGQAFTVAGAPIARNAAVAELGAEVAVSRNASLGLNYSGQYGGGNREHAGSLNVRWRY